jgi:hypothetical protein
LLLVSELGQVVIGKDTGIGRAVTVYLDPGQAGAIFKKGFSYRMYAVTLIKLTQKE